MPSLGDNFRDWRYELVFYPHSNSTFHFRGNSFLRRGQLKPVAIKLIKNQVLRIRVDLFPGEL